MIYFVRHGSTDWNENKNNVGQRDPKCQGRKDLPLNEAGIKQATETAKLLSKINFDEVLCSPLTRAIQTCKIIYNGNKPIIIDKRLTERDFGKFEGKTREEFDFKEFWNRNSNKDFGNAESIKEIEKRVFELLDELRKTPEKDVLIVSHGGVGCIMISYFKGIPSDGNYLSFEVPNGKPLILDFDEIKKR